MKSTYRLAGHTIKIESLYSQVHTLCAAYRVEDDAEYCITTAPADIAYERQRFARADELEGAAVREHADPYLETLAVYRKLAQLLVQDDILLMHGAVVAVDGQAYLFTAKSGTGKTTHTRLWMQQFGDRAVMVNGDKPLLHQDTHTNPACGVGVNIQLALQSFYMDIQQAAENRMRQITLRDILDQYHARVKESSK